jgi:hypothetical protein
LEKKVIAYSSEVVALDRFSLTRATEPTLVNKVRKLLCHLFFDLGNCRFEALLCPMRDVEVERRILLESA